MGDKDLNDLSDQSDERRLEYRGSFRSFPSFWSFTCAIVRARAALSVNGAFVSDEHLSRRMRAFDKVGAFPAASGEVALGRFYSHDASNSPPGEGCQPSARPCDRRGS